LPLPLPDLIIAAESESKLADDKSFAKSVFSEAGEIMLDGLGEAMDLEGPQ
jgi:hypothetical protein